MDFHELSSRVDTFIRKQGGYWDLPWMLAALTEELGELSRALQVFADIRDLQQTNESKITFQSIKEESGDLLFALLCLTNSLNINLDEALLNTLTKYEQRSTGL